MSEAGNSDGLTNLFIKGAHHKNLTALYLVQNIFNKNKNQRTISLNSHYNVLFRNERDAKQFHTLAQQVQPGQSKWLLDAFEDATNRPYGYLVLDHHPQSMREMRVLSNILPGETLTVYCKGKSV